MSELKVYFNLCCLKRQGQCGCVSSAHALYNINYIILQHRRICIDTIAYTTHIFCAITLKNELLYQRFFGVTIILGCLSTSEIMCIAILFDPLSSNLYHHYQIKVSLEGNSNLCDPHEFENFRLRNYIVRAIKKNRHFHKR